MPSADTVQHGAIGMGHHIGVEMDVHFGSAQHNDVNHAGKVALAVPVVGGEGRGVDMVRVFAHGAHAVQVKGLAIEDVIGEAFLEHFDQVFGGAAANEAGFYSCCDHHFAQIGGEGQGRAACARLKRETVLHDACRPDEFRGQLGDVQPVRRAGEPRGARNDFRRVAHLIHLHHVIDILPHDLPRHTGKRHQVIGDDNRPVRIEGIGQTEAEESARRRTPVAGGVAKGIGGRGGDDGNVDVDLAILHGLPAAAMTAQHRGAVHLAL